MTSTELHDRLAPIRERMIDAIGHMVEAIEARAALRAERQAALYGEIAALTCRKAACRRAQRCRGEPRACSARARAEGRAAASFCDD